MSNKPRRIRDKIFSDYVETLQKSDYFQLDFKTSFNRCLKELDKDIASIICYGLGSFHDGVHVASRYQLALLILIHQLLSEQSESTNRTIEIFDPSFERTDIETLVSFQKPEFKLISTNEYCSRTLHDHALVYMPHLDKYLYNNLLGSNWNQANLDKVIILGNSFQEMIDCETESTCRLELHYLNSLVKNFDTSIGSTSRHKRQSQKINTNQEIEQAKQRPLVEIPVDDSSFKHLDIFNSLSFHFLRKDWLNENSHKITRSLLKDWQPATSCSNDNTEGFVTY